MSVVATILEGQVAPERASHLRAAYSDAAAGPFPPGLLSSSLLRSASDPNVWRIQTYWASDDDLKRMRTAGKPRGVQIFEAANAAPVLSIFEVVDQLAPPD